MNALDKFIGYEEFSYEVRPNFLVSYVAVDNSKAGFDNMVYTGRVTSRTITMEHDEALIKLACGAVDRVDVGNLRKPTTDNIKAYIKVSETIVEEDVQILLEPPVLDRNKCEITKGGLATFHGNKVRIKWIDHAYITIRFIDLASQCDIALNKPDDGTEWGTYNWVDRIPNLKMIKDKE